MRTGTPEKRKFWRSIRIQAGLLYLVLAFANILFFSLMILEDQNDLLRGRLNQTADEIVVRLRDNLNRFPVLGRDRDEGLERLRAFLDARGADSFQVFDGEGRLWHEVRAGAYVDPEPAARVADRIMKRTLEIGDRNSVLYKPYHAELDEDDYSIARFILPLRTTAGETAYLFTTMRLDGARELLARLYVQVALAAAWGLVFFLLFAFLIYRFYIRRVDELTAVSRRMAAGELEARVAWKREREDEIDEMGSAFNAMAARIEEKIRTVTELNAVMADELETGRQVQANFLPRSDLGAEFHATTFFRPLRAVSGDIYHFYRLSRRRRAVLLADAAGHGASGALITAVALTGLDAVLRENDQPEAIIAGLNKILEEKLSDEFFMTAVFLVLDGRRTMRFINAGHPPILVLRPASAEVFELRPNGPPLGIMRDMAYPAERFACRAGDRVVVFSDALFESLDRSGQPFGLERLKELLRVHRDLDRRAFGERVLADFDGIVPRLDDDLTLIVLDVE